MAKVLVTGSEGFIGSHLVEELLKAGHQVRAFILYNSFNSWGWLEQLSEEDKEKIEVFAGDIRDPFGVKEAMKGCEVVLHLAALISIPYSYHSPADFVATNISGTLNVLQAARELGVARVVHTSTSEVYGTALFVPITEEHPLQGQSPYSASKIAADQMALAYWRSFKTPVTILRPFNTYGPRQSARAVIPTIITQLLAGKENLRLGSLHPTRDFNFVKDTAKAFVRAAFTPGIDGEVINAASNFEISVGDLVDEICAIIGRKVEIETDDKRIRPPLSEVERLWGDNSRTKKLLAFEPEYGGREGLKKGLKETIEWFKNPVNLAGYKPGIYNI